MKRVIILILVKPNLNGAMIGNIWMMTLKSRKLVNRQLKILWIVLKSQKLNFLKLEFLMEVLGIINLQFN